LFFFKKKKGINKKKKEKERNLSKKRGDQGDQPEGHNEKVASASSSQ